MSVNRQTEISELEIGNVEKDIIQDTNAHAGTWRKIYIITNTVFTTLTDSKLKTGAYTVVTFAAGQILYGDFSVIQLASGAVIAYR